MSELTPVEAITHDIEWTDGIDPPFCDVIERYLAYAKLAKADAELREFIDNKPDEFDDPLCCAQWYAMEEEFLGTLETARAKLYKVLQR